MLAKDMMMIKIVAPDYKKRLVDTLQVSAGLFLIYVLGN